MSKKFELSIKQPCHEKWGTFNKSDNIGYCESCRKNVIDFTKSTDSEIIEFFKKVNNRDKICGRFRSKQLKSYEFYEQKTSNHAVAFIAAGMLTIANVDESEAKNINKNIAISTQNSKVDSHFKHFKTPLTDSITYTIKGRILSSEDQSPLPGVNVILKDTQIGTTSDLDGNFNFNYTGSIKNVTVFFSFIGFESTEREITLSGSSIDLGEIQLHQDVLTLGEVVVGYECSTRGNIFKRLWYNLFVK